ncbi:hypothetical protein [Mycobacterium camsae]|uniref:hypothetical protein n=1 Tax=Mycobacterium gordonae TaxID=1778 RepID=UPI0019802DD8|nr:hypothetical protein [Mycobacterium gordonae]
MSAAINKTMPIIEMPVIDGLPAIKAANNATGSRLAVAAGIYADTDRALGSYLSQVEISPTSRTRPPDASRVPGGRISWSPDDVTRYGPALTAPSAALPQFDAAPAQLGQVSEVSTAVGPTAQGVQAVTSAIQGAVQSAGIDNATEPDNPTHPSEQVNPDDEGGGSGRQSLPNTFPSATSDRLEMGRLA